MQNTPIIEANTPAFQITSKVEASAKSINSIRTHATRVSEHVFSNSLAPRKQASNATSELSNLKNTLHAPQSPIYTSLGQQNTNKCKQSVQIRNKVAFAQRKPQIFQSQIPPIKSDSLNISKSHHPKIKSVLFASCYPTFQSHIPNSQNSNLNYSLPEIKYLNKITNKMPSKKRIFRVRFNESSRAAEHQSTSGNATRPASQRSNSLSNSRTANQQVQTTSNPREASSPLDVTPTSPTPSSNASTPLTLSPHVPTFDYIVSKIFNESLIASLTSKDAVLKEVRYCILTNNERRLKALNPYIHFYWRDLHVRSGCVCIDDKVAVPNVLREALTDDIHASHPGTWGMICMATHCWCT